MYHLLLKCTNRNINYPQRGEGKGGKSCQQDSKDAKFSVPLLRICSESRLFCSRRSPWTLGQLSSFPFVFGEYSLTLINGANCCLISHVTGVTQDEKRLVDSLTNPSKYDKNVRSLSDSPTVVAFNMFVRHMTDDDLDYGTIDVQVRHEHVTFREIT